jgi:hypothetical protein
MRLSVTAPIWAGSGHMVSVRDHEPAVAAIRLLLRTA